MSTNETLYRRPLPADTIAFSSTEGRRIFVDALAAGGLDGYFPLAEQFHTQADPSFCGLGSLVVALNALGIDPGRLWKGPWRWFSEELLDCCVSPEEIKRRGLSLDELACLARCNGADVELVRGDADNLPAFRIALGAAARGDAVLIVAYDRSALGQTGSGHFSPIGGYHAGRDLALVLDVARFKYPPHWISVERMWRATHAIDSSTGRARGWMLVRPRARGTALGFTLTCAGDDLQGIGARLTATVTRVGPQASLAELARAVEPLTTSVEVRVPTSTVHRDALETMRGSIRGLAGYQQIADAVGPARAEGVALLLLAIADGLPPGVRALLTRMADGGPIDAVLVEELGGLRAQLAALGPVDRN